STVPISITGLTSGVTSVAAGSGFALAIQNGGAWAWGLNNAGQLGTNSLPTINSTQPIPVTGLTSGVTAIAAGGAHGLALKDGGVYSWGLNANGQLGDGSSTNRSTPMPVTGLTSGVTAIAAGSSHSLAIRNGAVWAWGWNVVGQLGDGSTNDQL